MIKKKLLGFWEIWNMSFGFLGIQFGFALQGGFMSSIFQTLGASKEEIPLLWIAAPLTGLLVQPIVGYMSDRTWSVKWGRRRPYFLIGAVLSSLTLFFVPYSPTLWIAAGCLWVLDASINISMEPFRALVADKLPNSQRSYGFVVQTLIIGIGTWVASNLPWFMSELGVSDVAEQGTLPMSVKVSFAIGAFIFFLSILYTVLTTSEYPPEDMKEFLKEKQQKNQFLADIINNIGNMPSTMKKLGLIQFFSWFAFFTMWTMANPALTDYIFDAPAPISEEIISPENERPNKFTIVAMQSVQGQATKDKRYDEIKQWILDRDTNQEVEIYGKWKEHFTDGYPQLKGYVTPAEIDQKFKETRYTLVIPIGPNWLTSKYAEVLMMGVVPFLHPTYDIKENLVPKDHFIRVSTPEDFYAKMKFLDENPDERIKLINLLQEKLYNSDQKSFIKASSLVGSYMGIYGLSSMMFALLLVFYTSKRRINRKLVHMASLILGGVGFLLMYFIPVAETLIISFILIGFSWGSILSMPYAMLSSSVDPKKMGVFMGIFNMFIVIPQIIAALGGINFLSNLLGTQSINSMIVAGISLIIAGICNFLITNKNAISYEDD